MTSGDGIDLTPGELADAYDKPAEETDEILATILSYKFSARYRRLAGYRANEKARGESQSTKYQGRRWNMQESHELFVDIRTPVPGTETAREVHREAHRVYHTQLKQEGKLFMAGSFKDSSGGLVIFSVNSREEAMELSSNDPYVVHGIHKSNVKALNVRIW